VTQRTDIRATIVGYTTGQIATFREFFSGPPDESMKMQPATGRNFLRAPMNLCKSFLPALLLAAPLLHAQTTAPQSWFTVTAENPSLAVVLPAGSTYRFGDSANNLWSAPITVTQATTISPVSMSGSDPFPFADPDPGAVKELDVVETSATQTIAVDNLASATVASLTVPAIVQTAPSSNWYTLTPESATIAVLLPAGATYRFGDSANNRWSTPVTVTQATTFSPVFFPDNVFPFADPDPGSAKELDILETASAQSVAVTDLSTSPASVAAVSVPGLVAPVTVGVAPGATYTLTFSNFAIAPNTTQNALMFAFVNAPASDANRTWEGTQMNVTIGGVTMVCSYGQTYTDGVFTLSCTVPTQTASTQTTTTATP
jgi:hypothetical protein